MTWLMLGDFALACLVHDPDSGTTGRISAHRQNMTFELQSHGHPPAMTVVGKSLNRALNLVGDVSDSVISIGTTVVEKTVARASSGAKPVTLTIARPRSEVEQVWRDAATLSRILGTVADVAVKAPNQYRWSVHVPGGDDVEWDSQLIDIPEGLRFVGTGDGPAGKGATEVSVLFRDAPADLGTEVTLSLRLPAPNVVLRGAAFKVLYRARALLQTGELPTLTPTPSARPGDR